MKEKNSYKLTNRDISHNFRDIKLWLMPSDFLGAFAYWVAAQNPNNTFMVDKSLKALFKHVKPEFGNLEIPEMFTYEKLSRVISENAFKNIPDILALNEMKPDFIDLGALARNIFYMIIRITIQEQ